MRVTTTVVDEPVARVEMSGATTLQKPALTSHLGAVRLTVNDAVELESGVTAEHESVNIRTEHRGCLEPGKQKHHLDRGEWACGLDRSILVDKRREHDGLDPRSPQGGKSRRRGGGEIEAHG